VSLAGELSLTDDQVTRITGMWQELSPFDKRRVKYPARHRSKLPLGRFARAKKSTVTAGTDSVKR